MYWPVVAASALLVGLLTYGVAIKGTDTSIDQALVDGDARRRRRPSSHCSGAPARARSPTTAARSS